jgi:hypothetical protein
MLLFGSNGPPTQEAVERHAPAHLASVGPKGGHEGSAGLFVHRFATPGAGVELSSHSGARRHCGVRHLGSPGLVGGHEGSAGLSVHRSAGTGDRAIEAVWNISEASCKLLAPRANPTTTAPAPAAFATMPIECAYFPIKLCDWVGGITPLTLLRKPRNAPGPSYGSPRKCSSAPHAHRSGTRTVIISR